MVETDTLADFIEDVRDVFRSTANPTDQAARVADLTEDLMATPGWLEEEIEALGGDQIRLGTLYVDDEYGHPEPGFRLTTGMIDPGKEPPQSNLAHDHGLAWVIYGTYSGQREQTIYDWVYNGADVPHLGETARVVQQKGDVIVVPPGKIHQQRTVGTETSINFRVESQDMSDRARHWYNVVDGTAESSVKPTVA